MNIEVDPEICTGAQALLEWQYQGLFYYNNSIVYLRSITE